MNPPTVQSPSGETPAIARSPALSVGDIAPGCALPAQDGGHVDISSDAIAGNPLVLVFCSGDAIEVARALGEFTAKRERFVAAGARLFAITRPATAPPPGSRAPFPVLLDADGGVFKRFDADGASHVVTVVLRPNHHVMAILRAETSEQAAQALGCVERLAEERRPVTMGHHPPVLMVPDVLTASDCRHLVSVFETRGRRFMPPGPGIDYIGTDYKMRVPEHGRRDRIDHWIVDDDTTQFVQWRIEHRLLPEIAKAFHYRITRWERMRIGCYEGARGGQLHGHRDNVEPTPYRRFAMSINLNVDEFTGGELRFPEFGDQRYRPPNGTAFVFSSSLLHEALHVTSGRRLVVLAFMFGDH
jgi:peroxiredoxin